MSELASSGDPAKNRALADFDALAATYDELRFLQPCARRLAEGAALWPGARVLDVATGTGVVALRAAQIVGPTGRVVGIDWAPEMLARARQKAAAENLHEVVFQQGDAERLDFPDRSFDAVLSASSLFFFPNIPGALQEWGRVLTAGGWVGFSSFGPTFLQPLRDMWEACLRRYGLKAASLPTHRIPDPDTCQQLLSTAGFMQIEVRAEQLGYYVPTAEERWKDILAGLEGKPLSSLDPARQEQVKAEHLKDLDALSTARGIWVDVPALFAFGRKAPRP